MMNNLRELILFLMWDNFDTYVSMDIFLFYLPSLRDLVATCRFFLFFSARNWVSFPPKTPTSTVIDNYIDLRRNLVYVFHIFLRLIKSYSALSVNECTVRVRTLLLPNGTHKNLSTGDVEISKTIFQSPEEYSHL